MRFAHVRHNGAMTLPNGIVTCLPDIDVEELVGIVEVLIQEQLPAFVVPLSAMRELRAVFGQRAVLGTWEIVDADGVRASHKAGADFVFADVADADMVAAAQELGIPFHATATTPLEVRALLALGATGALLWPADVVGHVMAQHLARVGLAGRTIPMGGLGAFAAGEWLKAGAPAAAVDSTLLGDAVDGGDLGQLRDRCGSFRKAAQRAVEHRAQTEAADD